MKEYSFRVSVSSGFGTIASRLLLCRAWLIKTTSKMVHREEDQKELDIETH